MARARLTRRDFLSSGAIAGLGLVAAPSLLARGGAWAWPQAAGETPAGWADVDAILARIVAPVFPDRAFDITKFGAVGDGVRDCTSAFRDAIAACAAAGGGRVIVPAGRFLTGAIHLRSRINLHVSDGATIAFSREPKQYLPVVFTRWEGVELMNYSALIYAFEQKDIAITGKGTLDGQAGPEHWWPWKGTAGAPAGTTQAEARAKLIDMGARGVPVAERVFGDGSRLRPNFIQPYRCQNVLIEGVTIVNSPMWEIHPVLCTNVTVRRVSINSHGPEQRRLRPRVVPRRAHRGVHVRHRRRLHRAQVRAQRGRAPGERADRERHHPRLRDEGRPRRRGDRQRGVWRGAPEIFAEKCRMDSPNLDRALRIKTNSVRGGYVERVFMRDLHGRAGRRGRGHREPVLRGRRRREVPAERRATSTCATSRARRASTPCCCAATRTRPMRNVRITDCTFDNVEKDDVIEGVSRLTLTNVSINGKRRTETISR